MRGYLPKTAIARMGCCTSLLYGPIGASKNTVKERLTLIPRLSATGTVSVIVHLGIWLPTVRLNRLGSYAVVVNGGGQL